MKYTSLIVASFLTAVSCQTALAEESEQIAVDEGAYTVEQARKNLCSQFRRPDNCDPSQFERTARKSLCDSAGTVFLKLDEEAKRDALEATFLALKCRRFYQGLSV